MHRRPQTAGRRGSRREDHAGTEGRRPVALGARPPEDSMKELRTEIEIHAPAERVWRHLTDFAAFPEWNPFIPRIRGELRVGSRLEVLLQASGTKGMTFRPTVKKGRAQPRTPMARASGPPGALRWRTHLRDHARGRQSGPARAA